MNGAVSQTAIGAFEAAPAHVISELALARIGAEGGATRADIPKSVAPLVSHRLSPSELRRAAETGLELLEAGRLGEVQDVIDFLVLAQRRRLFDKRLVATLENKGSDNIPVH